MKQILLLMLGVIFAITSHAQKTVTGTVTGEGEGPLIGATVQVKGTSAGTVTDFDGKYSINIPQGANTLVVSFIGFTTVETNIDGQEVINVQLPSGKVLSEVVIVGSRSAGRTKLESAVPVDVLDVKNLALAAPQTNLNQMLNYVAPSFTSNTQTISDGTDHIDPASLRGLGPDQVLVLVNGKRRHTSSLVNVNGTFGRGNVGTDLNALPAAAIERIEILRDGAAAQYGSDAIAGVINLIMRDDYNKLTANFTSGAYFSEGSNFFTGGSDGDTYDLSLNYGLPLGSQGGFINFTGAFESRGWTSRMKEYSGSIYNAYNAVERLARAKNFDVANLTEGQIRTLITDLNYLNDTQRNNILNASDGELHDLSGWNTLNDLAAMQGIQVNSDNLDQLKGLLPDISYLSADQLAAAQNAGDFDAFNNALSGVSGPLAVNVTDAELAQRGLERTDFNMRIGQSELRGGKFFMNMELPLGNKAEIYAFGGLSLRDGLATGFYRFPNQERTYSPAYPDGFLPEIHTDVNDQSIAVGIRGDLRGWNADFSNTFGRNAFRYNVQNSNNATLQNSTPFEFDSGGFAFSQNTANFDLSRYWDGVLYGLNVAFGTEFRVENYQINAGGQNSYASFDRFGQVVTPTTPSEDLVTDFFGRGRPGGAQVFPGFRPDNELDEFRNSVAAYTDIEADITESWLLTGAVRFENYSDFGSTTNFKVSSRYKVTDDISIRGAFSTGFRAPSLAQIYFNSTSTLFVDGIPNEVGTFSNNSRIARILGIPQLKEETSQSISLGFTSRIPAANLSLTIDAFQVDIDDRVVLTGTFDPGDGRTDAQKEELARLFAQANAEQANFFANSIDTRSQGIDIVLTHDLRFSGGTLKTSLSGIFSKTEKVGDVQTSAELEGLEDVYFDETSRIYLEEAVPRTKFNLTFNLSAGKFNAFLRNVYFGEVTEATNNVDNQQVFSGKVVTDVSVGYQLARGINLTIGANNLLDVYPDENIPANQGAGQFLYSRRSQQFGFMGRFAFGRLIFTL
ncbi:MAG: TonB-dependent receptor [Phaeodactylibacter sp.]|nr:TonB-dependent receptor [Phaeodactylibacter sp.]MCB9297141.1 TonB-dependent receptor [Lewinellaceae bacterium]